MDHRLTAAWLISAATAVAMQPASAADMPVKAIPAMPPAIASGFFGYVQGMYVFEPNHGAGQFANTLGATAGAARPGDGLGGAFLIGYRFAGPWDVSFGMHHTRFRDGDRERFPACAPNFAQMTDPRITSADGSIGYNISTAQSATRMYAGVRYAQWKHHLTDTCNGRQNDAETKAIGPRIGVDHSIKLGASTSLIMGANASFLFADVEDTVTTPAGALIGASKIDRTVFQSGAHLAVGWNVTPLITLAAGYKFDHWVGMISNNAGFSAATGIGGGRSNVLEHGPFARASYNFGVQ
jgi:hypothetical protein